MAAIGNAQLTPACDWDETISNFSRITSKKKGELNRPVHVHLSASLNDVVRFIAIYVQFNFSYESFSQDWAMNFAIIS